MVDDVCDSGVISPPEVNNAGYSCPSAGLYNFHFTHDIWGTESAWYSSWSGFSEGIAVHLQHEGGGKDYAMCHFDIYVKKSADTSFAKTSYFVGVASLGVIGLITGMFMRKRQLRCGRDDREETYEEDEATTNFELVEDTLRV